MAMARRASVTVSMAADASGILSRMSRVMRVGRSTAAGSTSEEFGTSETSSTVRASSIIRLADRLRRVIRSVLTLLPVGRQRAAQIRKAGRCCTDSTIDFGCAPKRTVEESSDTDGEAFAAAAFPGGVGIAEAEFAHQAFFDKIDRK